jgi:hypothetical protein
MMYNAAYATGALVFAAFMHANGKSPVIVAVIAAGFLLAAAAYRLAAGRANNTPAAEPPSAHSADGALPSPSADTRQ